MNVWEGKLLACECGAEGRVVQQWDEAYKIAGRDWGVLFPWSAPNLVGLFGGRWDLFPCRSCMNSAWVLMTPEDPGLEPCGSCGGRGLIKRAPAVLSLTVVRRRLLTEEG